MLITVQVLQSQIPLLVSPDYEHLPSVMRCLIRSVTGHDKHGGDQFATEARERAVRLMVEQDPEHSSLVCDHECNGHDWQIEAKTLSPSSSSHMFFTPT